VKILIAEDDVISRRLLETTLIRWGYEVVVTCDGTAAWEVLQSADAPPLAILDWMMPGTDGIEVCRKVRRAATPTPPYLILLTAKGRREDIVAGLRSGANDYVTKPFNREELRARVQVGMRIVELQHSLADRVKALEEASRGSSSSRASCRFAHTARKSVMTGIIGSRSKAISPSIRKLNSATASAQSVTKDV